MKFEFDFIMCSLSKQKHYRFYPYLQKSCGFYFCRSVVGKDLCRYKNQRMLLDI